MKKLLLAFALIGFITTASYASTTTVKVGSEIEFCDDDKDCDKKDCKHDKKECKKGEKKACCAKKDSAKKSCCDKKKGSGKSCHKSKKSSTTTPIKKENKEK